jgi:glycosyltransferase involved in cell wall biosynthesis
MRIAINTLAMKSKLHGVGNYIKNLVWSLSSRDSKNEYLLFVSKENIGHVQGLPANFEIVLAPGNPSKKILWEQFILPGKLKKYSVDLYHGPSFSMPFVKTCLQVVTIHDASFNLTPEHHPMYRRHYYRATVPGVMRNVDAVISVSQRAKSDLLKLVSVTPQKISVVPLGVDPRFHSVKNENKLLSLRNKYDLPRPFILFVGMIEPRKNIELLVDAYLSGNCSDRFDLVLAGSLGWDHSQLLQKITASAKKHCIRLPGYIEDADLPALYSAAEVFVYPSIYEGFGLPILESMACGTPVITSSVSSLPEVAGNAALLVDPRNLADLAWALQKVLAEKSLRDELTARGLQRAAIFTWDLTAQKTLSVYQHLVFGHPHPIPRNSQDALSSHKKAC